MLHLSKSFILLVSMIPNTFLFQLFKISFKALNFASKTKLKVPIKVKLPHHFFIWSLNPFSSSHMFANLKSEGPLFKPPPSRRMGKCSETSLGRIPCTAPLTILSQLSVAKNWSCLDWDWLFNPPRHVKGPPYKGKSLCSKSSTTSENLLIVAKSPPLYYAPLDI